MKAADTLDRGIAMVTTCWLALESAQTPEDQSRIADTLFEAQSKLLEAAKSLGVYLQDGDQQ